MPNINPNAVIALVEYQWATTVAVPLIMKCIVADNLEEKCTNENITLLLWHYNDDALHEKLLHDIFVNVLTSAAEADIGKRGDQHMQYLQKDIVCHNSE
eukprot:7150055-Ditylum_brightwellii.AAC.1